MRFASVSKAPFFLAFVAARGALAENTVAFSGSSPGVAHQAEIIGQGEALASKTPTLMGDLHAWIEQLSSFEPVRRLLSLFATEIPSWFLYLGAAAAGLCVLWVIWLIRLPLRRRAAPGASRSQEAPGPSAGGEVSACLNPSRLRPSPFMPPLQGLEAGKDEDSPDWLDDLGFLEIAQTAFLRLQGAWDHADYGAMHQCAAPQFFTQLLRERKRQEGTQYTEVFGLQAELQWVRREGDLVCADVVFTGQVRDEEEGLTEDFKDVWRMEHSWSDPHGAWRVAGIRQLQP